MRKLICWDMDETLGSFRGDRPVLTKDILRVLKRLKEKGHRHVITTISPRTTAESRMREAGLISCFDRIFGLKDVLSAGRGKSYSIVISQMGIQNPSDEMLIVGNNSMDAPDDVNSVFVLHPRATEYSAEVFNTVISELGKHGSFSEGFSFMQSVSKDTLVIPDYTGEVLEVDQISISVGAMLLKGRVVPRVLLINQVPEKFEK